DIRDAKARRGRKLPLRVGARMDAGEPRGTAAPRQLGKHLERRARITKAMHERAKGAWADILAADQAEPIDALFVRERKLRLVAVVHNAPGRVERGHAV